MSDPKTPERSILSRRRVFAGAGAAGALAAAATLLPGTPEPVAVVADASPAPGADGRYQATPHVLHYYRTARV